MAQANKTDLLQLARTMKAHHAAGLQIATRLEALLGDGGPSSSTRKGTTKKIIAGVLLKANKTMAARAARFTK